MFSAISNWFFHEKQTEAAPFVSEQQLPRRILLEKFLREKTRLFDLFPGDGSSGSSNSSSSNSSSSNSSSSNSSSGEGKNHSSTLIKGAVQSGKSRILFALCLLHGTYQQNANVMVLVRNFTDDYDQFQRNFRAFLDEYSEFLLQQPEIETDDDVLEYLPSFYYMGNVKKIKQNGMLRNHEDLCEDLVKGQCVVIALANDHQTSMMNDCLDIVAAASSSERELWVMIDEADQLIYSEGDKFTPQLDALLERSHHVYGISATLYETFYDPNQRFCTDRVFYLTPPPEYKGIDQLAYESIRKTCNGLMEDEDLEQFLQRQCDKEPFWIRSSEKHPMMTLIKTENLITEQDRLLHKIQTRFPKQYTIITYNGTCTKLYSESLCGERIVLPVCRKKQSSSSSTHDLHVFHNCALPYLLQYLKENGGAERFPRILIISYKLVGRGINIVSADFQWHLTHMFYRPSKGTSVTSMIQSMRLCGNYQDTIPLTCLMEKEYYENMYKGHRLQEDLFYRIQNESTGSKEDDDPPKSLTEWLQTQKFMKDKIPDTVLYKKKGFQGKITDRESEDQGMSMTEFNQNRCITPSLTLSLPPIPTPQLDQKEKHRLTNDQNGMFKKWAQLSNTSAIAVFMREGLDPKKTYDRSEIQSLCKKHKIQLSHICCTKNQFRKGSQIHGQLLWKHHQTPPHYSLHPCLVKDFEKYF